MERYSGFRKRTAIAFYILSIFTFLVSLERLVFDVFGQMWGTMLLNGMSTISLLAGLLAVCAAEKVAIALYAGWSVLSIGLNIVIILVYNDVGLLSQKEHILGLMVGNDNWWRTHGISCTSVSGDGSGGPWNGTESNQWEEFGDTCVLPYTVIETVHAAIFMFLTVITFALSLVLLCSRENKHRLTDDDDDFSYLSIGQYNDNSHSHPCRYNNRPRRASLTSRSKILI